MKVAFSKEPPVIDQLPSSFPPHLSADTPTTFYFHQIIKLINKCFIINIRAKTGSFSFEFSVLTVSFKRKERNQYMFRGE